MDDAVHDLFGIFTIQVKSVSRVAQPAPQTLLGKDVSAIGLVPPGAYSVMALPVSMYTLPDESVHIGP
jgi:hypothetical protein